MAQWWERSPPTNVARVQIPTSTPYVGWVCCWFSPLSQEVFLRVLQFSPLLKNWHFQIPIWPGEPLCGCATSKSLFIYTFLKFDRHSSKLVKINCQSSKLPLFHWDALFREVLKGSFGLGVPPRRALKPWPRLRTKIVHFETLFMKRETILWP